MGTWGMKAFENDCAADFTSELAESDNPIELLSNAFSDLDDEYIELDEGQQAIIAAAIVLHWSGGTDAHIGDFVKEKIANNHTPVNKSLVHEALAALSLIVSDSDKSEIYELWEEADDFDVWLAEVQLLKDQLAEYA